MQSKHNEATMMEIKHKTTQATLFSFDCTSFKECVKAAVRAKADLSGANLSGTNLRVADLAGADLAGADSAGADLFGADLRGANLSGADLRGADLSGANLSGTNLRVADLSEADLSEADLSDADLSDADLSGANLNRAELKHTCIIDGGCDSKGDRFVAYRLKGHFVYCVGFNTWNSIEVALAYYGDPSDNGDNAECIARLELLHKLAVGRWGE